MAWPFSQRNKVSDLAWSQFVEATCWQYPYTTDFPFRDTEVKAWIAEGGLEAAATRLNERWRERALTGEGTIHLGQRPADVSPGAAIEEEAEALQTGASTVSEYRHLEREHAKAAEALKGWYAVADVPWHVFLPEEVRARHLYVIGKTGAGKSTLLKWLAFQDALRGRGFAFMTPDGETIDELLPYLPEARAAEVVYFNPSDSRCAWHLNPFWLDDSDDFDRKAEAVFSLLLRLLDDVGPRVQQILRQAVYALLELDGATLLDLPELLRRDDAGVQSRRRASTRLRDPETRAFWETGYEALPVNAHLPITSRLVPFLRPRVIRQALCRQGRGIPYRALMDGQGVLLCNLSDGLIGESASKLLGGLIVSELQLAATSRADVSASERPPFYLYLDEFQSFVDSGNVSYEKLLSRARKYGLPLILAHQQTGQLGPALTRDVLGNVGACVAFATGRDDASRMSREFLSPTGSPVAPERLQQQDPGEAWVRIGNSAFPFAVTTQLEDLQEMRDQESVRAITAHNRLEAAPAPPVPVLRGAPTAPSGPGGDEPEAFLRDTTPRPASTDGHPNDVGNNPLDDFDPADYL